MAEGHGSKPLRAAAVLRALNELDPYKPERDELRALHVPEATIAALYPADFASLSFGLAEHLKAHGVDHLREIADRITEFAQTAQGTMARLDSELIARWKSFHVSQEAEGSGFWALHHYLWGEFGESAKTIDLSGDAIMLLMRGWWLATNFSLLPRHLQVNSNLRMNWISKYMLPALQVVND